MLTRQDIADAIPYADKLYGRSAFADELIDCLEDERQGPLTDEEKCLVYCVIRNGL